MATKRPQAGEITMTDLSKAQPTPIRVETSMGALSLFPQRFEDIGAFSKSPIDEPSLTRLRLRCSALRRAYRARRMAQNR
jgi:hypothetical protein